jgi:PilZ domain
VTNSRPEIKNVRHLRRSLKSPLNRRWAAAWYAELHTRNGLVPCTVEDVSADGAKVRVGRVPIDGQNVKLVFPNVSPIEACITWRRQDLMGVEFATSQPWIVDFVQRATETGDWFPMASG